MDSLRSRAAESRGINGMLTAEKIKKQKGDYICRRCINRIYGTNLEREDCKYGYFAVCRGCNNDANIVVGFTLSGQMKVLLK